MDEKKDKKTKPVKKSLGETEHEKRIAAQALADAEKRKRRIR